MAQRQIIKGSQCLGILHQHIEKAVNHEPATIWRLFSSRHNKTVTLSLPMSPRLWCLWVMDETQLMGPGLWTSGQLDWMRNHRFGVMKPCASWWMSATTSPVFLDTPDRRKQQLAIPFVVEVGDDQKVVSR